MVSRASNQETGAVDIPRRLCSLYHESVNFRVGVCTVSFVLTSSLGRKYSTIGVQHTIIKAQQISLLSK